MSENTSRWLGFLCVCLIIFTAAELFPTQRPEDVPYYRQGREAQFQSDRDCVHQEISNFWADPVMPHSAPMLQIRINRCFNGTAR